jgi:hypothetical protein
MSGRQAEHAIPRAADLFAKTTGRYSLLKFQLQALATQGVTPVGMGRPAGRVVPRPVASVAQLLLRL